MIQNKTTKNLPNYEIWKYRIESIDKPFNSLETVQKYIYGSAKRHDNFTDLWNDLGYSRNYSDNRTKHKYIESDKQKKLLVWGANWFYKEDKGTVIDFLINYKNYTFDGAYQYIAKVYNLEYELVNLNDFKTSKPQKATNTKKDKEVSNKDIKTALAKETLTYFENRIYNELGLNEVESKNYFFPYFPSLNDTDFGIGIKYTNLENEPIKYGSIKSECTEFDRIRLTNPIGKKKYHSQKDSGYFPYLTPLANNKELLSNKVLYSIEGEFKAFFAVHKLQIPCIGIGGIHLGINVESKTDSKGYSYKDKHTAEFLPLTKEVIEKGKFESYTLIFDSDTFSNEGKKDRALSFSSAIERQIIAAKKVGIKEFTFTCINPNNPFKIKGLDDLYNHCEPSEIRQKLECNLYHNDLFYHFRIDTSKPSKKAFETLKDAFLASFETKKETQKIVTTGYIGNQLTSDLNSPFVTSLISEKFTSLVAPTGLGKSYFIEKIFVPFMYQLGFITIFCSPRNALTKQQASESKGVVFTEKTNKNAIERLKFEIDTTKVVYSNYDNLDTAHEVLTNFYNKNVYIVIDESHLLTSDSTFRAETIAKVCKTLEKNELNLFLTATPTEIKLSKELNLFEVISTNKKHYERPTLVFTAKNKKIDCTLECIQKAVKNNKRVLVHFNCLDDCKALKKELQRQKIEVRICASNGINGKDLEFFESIQNDNSFEWNNEVKVILTTSVLEIGINLKTDKKTALIYVNTALYGFDNNSYSQFIARIRNYTDFKIDNTIISTNQKSFLPSDSLKLDFDFDLLALDFAAEQTEICNKHYKKLENEGKEIEKDRFVSKAFQNVLFDSENECFEVNKQDVFSDYTKHEIAKGSPYFTNPSKIVFYENGKIKDLEKAIEQIQKEKEAAEKAVFELYENDFYTLLSSVFKYSKDVKLQSKCNLRSNPNEPKELGNYELLAAENLLKHHFSLSKTIKKTVPNDLECTDIKQVITCKESRTIRKTSDLSKRKKAYITYFLLTNSGSQNRIREQLQINELQRILTILESCKGKETSLYELLKLANQNRKGKNLYNKKTFIELIEILFEFESSRKIKNEKKISFYSFEKQKDFILEMERLRT